MKNLFLFQALSLILIISACSISEPDKHATNKTVAEGATDASLFDFLKEVEIEMETPDAYTLNELFSKYQLVSEHYNQRKYANAAKQILIKMMVVKPEIFHDERVGFLIKELDQFGMAYPKESYILLGIAKDNNSMTRDELNSFIVRAQEKAIAKSYVWQHVVDPKSKEDVTRSSSSEVFAKYYDRAIYTDSLISLSLD